jgi:hypothetical protein
MKLGGEVASRWTQVFGGFGLEFDFGFGEFVVEAGSDFGWKKRGEVCG